VPDQVREAPLIHQPRSEVYARVPARSMPACQQA
jgi:hypothetical protein